MSSSISAIRDAIAARLATISGLNVYDTVPGQITTPAAVVRRRSGPRPVTLGGGNHEYTFVVTLFTSMANDKAAQDKLDSFLSPDGASSVHAAFVADEDLGSTVEYAVLADVEPDQVIEYSGISYVGADVIVEVGV